MTKPLTTKGMNWNEGGDGAEGAGVGGADGDGFMPLSDLRGCWGSMVVSSKFFDDAGD
jgi:hypothetical protein